MVTKLQLDKLRQTLKEASTEVYDLGVIFVEQDDRKNSMKIPQLNFDGTIEEGRRLLDKYTDTTVIVDDIPRWDRMEIPRPNGRALNIYTPQWGENE